MASIGDNTRALQEILTAVQNLPEGGGSSGFESGEYVRETDAKYSTAFVVCRLKAYPKAFIMLSQGIDTASSWVASAMFILDSYNKAITASTLVGRIIVYNDSSGAKTSPSPTFSSISTQITGNFYVTSSYQVYFTNHGTNVLRAGTYKWYAIY